MMSEKLHSKLSSDDNQMIVRPSSDDNQTIVRPSSEERAEDTSTYLAWHLFFPIPHCPRFFKQRSHDVVSAVKRGVMHGVMYVVKHSR